MHILEVLQSNGLLPVQTVGQTGHISGQKKICSVCSVTCNPTSTALNDPGTLCNRSSANHRERAKALVLAKHPEINPMECYAYAVASNLDITLELPCILFLFCACSRVIQCPNNSTGEAHFPGLAESILNSTSQ